MGTVVPLVAQEGNKYILTLIMKAIVAYALAAFAAIATTPNPIEATPTGWWYRRSLYRTDPYAYAVLARVQRHALEQPYEYYYDFGAASAKHDIYSAGDGKLDDRLTKRE